MSLWAVVSVLAISAVTVGGIRWVFSQRGPGAPASEDPEDPDLVA